MPENESAEKPRVRSLDMYKGIAILGVIAVHVFIFPTMQQGEAEGSGMPLVVQALYLGLLGFFAISGYFYRPNRGFANNVKKRLLILVLLPSLSHNFDRTPEEYSSAVSGRPAAE